MLYHCNTHIINAYCEYKVKQGSLHSLSRTNQSLTTDDQDWNHRITSASTVYGVWSKYSMFVEMQGAALQKSSKLTMLQCEPVFETCTGLLKPEALKKLWLAPLYDSDFNYESESSNLILIRDN